MASGTRDTRAALLDAGVQLLHELTPATLVAALRTREIARRAGVSAPAFFHHFRTVEEYAHALVERVYSPDLRPLRGVVTDGLRVSQRLPLPAEQSIDYHERDLRRAAADPDFRLRIGLWALGGSSVDGVHAGFLRQVDSYLLPQAQALHDVWGREVRPPLDPQSYLAVQIALVTGSVIRHIAEPQVMTPERYARAASALSMILLRPQGDRRTMDDRLSEMNWYVRSRRTVARSVRRESTRTRILDAASELFDEYGYEAASIARIARAAEVHVGTFYDHFESKAHLALTLLDLHARSRFPEAPDSPGDDPEDALRAHLERVAGFVAGHPDLARIYFGAMGSGELPSSLDDVLGQTTRARVAACFDRAPGPTTDRTTEQLLVATVGAVLRHPGDRPADTIGAAMRALPSSASISGART